jgi:hypothetical protein
MSPGPCSELALAEEPQKFGKGKRPKAAPMMLLLTHIRLMMG